MSDAGLGNDLRLNHKLGQDILELLETQGELTLEEISKSFEGNNINNINYQLQCLTFRENCCEYDKKTRKYRFLKQLGTFLDEIEETILNFIKINGSCKFKSLRQGFPNVKDEELNIKLQCLKNKGSTIIKNKEFHFAENLPKVNQDEIKIKLLNFFLERKEAITVKQLAMEIDADLNCVNEASLELVSCSLLKFVDGETKKVLTFDYSLVDMLIHLLNEHEFGLILQQIQDYLEKKDQFHLVNRQQPRLQNLLENLYNADKIQKKTVLSIDFYCSKMLERTSFDDLKQLEKGKHVENLSVTTEVVMPNDILDSGSIRYKSTLSLTSNSQQLEVISKETRHYEDSVTIGAHQMLDKIHKNSKLLKDVRILAKQYYKDALFRGISRRNVKYPLMEGVSYEFKGEESSMNRGKNKNENETEENRDWNSKSAVNALKKYFGLYICACLNAGFQGDDKVHFILGIHDETKNAHGIVQAINVSEDGFTSFSKFLVEKKKKIYFDACVDQIKKIHDKHPPSKPGLEKWTNALEVKFQILADETKRDMIYYLVDISFSLEEDLINSGPYCWDGKIYKRIEDRNEPQKNCPHCLPSAKS